MKRITTILLCLCTVLMVSALDKRQTKINSIKKDKAYLYAEITAPDEEEAQSFAEDMLYQEINRYASEQKNLRDAANIVVTNTRSLWEDISLPRGNCYRVFLYVKKADIFGADNVTVSTESALEDETYEEEAYEDTPMSEHRREAISRLLTLRKFSEMESCIKGLKQDGHISSYAGYKKIRTYLIHALSVLLLSFSFGTLRAENITVEILTDSYTDCPATLLQTMERNLGTLLTEINAANEADRDINTAGLPLNDFAKSTLVHLWSNIHFYCDDQEVLCDRLWPFRSSYMVRQIPMIMNPRGEQFGAGKYQECTVEFDGKGLISDISFVFDSQLSESMEKCGKVVELERKLQILKYCDRFRTAYCTKDINFLEQVFSEDALIITGNVVTTRTAENGVVQKVNYTKQNKQQYLTNLRRAFQRNKFIDVQFSEVGTGGLDGGCGTVTQSVNNGNFYGVRLKQEWHSSNYSDVGYIFLLWDFTNEEAPVIHVRTWQPEIVGGKKTQQEDIFSLSDFEKTIKENAIN